MCLVGVVVRRYIDFLILLILTPLVSVLFCSSIPTFVLFFSFFIYILYLSSPSLPPSLPPSFPPSLPPSLPPRPSAGIAVRSQQRPWGREGYSKATPTISVETHPPQPSTIALEEESEGGRGGGGGGGAGGGDSEEKVKSSATSQVRM